MLQTATTNYYAHLGDSMDNPAVYCNIVGGFQCVCVTQREIAKSVNRVSHALSSITTMESCETYSPISHMHIRFLVFSVAL